ncbi:unnamed protein product [Meloidogyne enterolobii]|uniref:Uncharacterized protein n=1 Tax=Meloidogyne enterolobii TaxID=390850 RepID=A0ACB0Y033_MELEN
MSSSNSSRSKIDSATWEKFFEACCDIPSETRKKYASAFVKQRIQPHLLRDLGKDDLKELGISALGDQVNFFFNFYGVWENWQGIGLTWKVSRPNRGRLLCSSRDMGGLRGKHFGLNFPEFRIRFRFKKSRF